VLAGVFWLACVFPSAADATSPGANGRIAYAAPPDYSGTSDELYTINADGSDPRRLSNDGFDEGQPAWSPDGERLVFAAARPVEGTAILIANADGDDARVIAHSRVSDPRPSFSMNGRRVLFTTGRKLITVRADGGGKRRTVTALPPGGGRLDDPTFAPDGRWIAFAGKPRPKDKDGIWKVRRDGTHERYVGGTRDLLDRWPDFSPDGRWIVFWASETGLWLIRANGTHRHHLSQPVEPSDVSWWGFPSFSPAGDRIVFSDLFHLGGRGALGCGDLYTVGTDGSDLRQVTHYATPHPGYCPTYAGSGAHLYPVAPSWQPLPGTG
jgi:TolB protein